ncbi:MAG TPA: FAD-dependent oxidoreductase [Novosphingobium sp.]|nr:FAD-dependent oxidoreductase [Novosphingobium sp.]
MADPVSTKTRIAVIGGGVGAMTTAYELTEQPGWSDTYEITVYQLGWRLGGKGASGRNQAMSDRIEEHGLHFWFGYYENAFNLIQRVYAALGRSPDQPLATWRDAFKPHSLFILMQFHKAQWSEWHLKPPAMPGVPGDGTIPPFWELVDRLLHALHIHGKECLPTDLHAQITGTAPRGWLGRLLERIGLLAERVVEDVEAAGLHLVRDLVQRAAAHPDPSAAQDLLHEAIAVFERFLGRAGSAINARIDRMIDNDIEAIPILRRLLSLIELGFYMFKGILIDDVACKGFTQLDHLDLREWLASHGAGSVALDSDTLRVAYESIFAFSQGSYAQPNLAAGAGLRGLLRLAFTYKEAFAWKMQAGMGDTIFGPFYEVLKARGVKFEFFSALREITPSDDGARIESLTIGRQATIKGGGEYQPLYDVRGLPCWPNQPLFDQLNEGAHLQQSGVNLESHWNQPADVATDILLIGQHFDQVVLGTSIGPIPFIAPKILMQKAPWQDMIDHVEIIGTQAFQIWTVPDSNKLQTAPDGEVLVEESERPIYGGFAQPHNTVSDMSHLLPRESWPELDPPGAIFYFCGPLPLAKAIPPLNDIFFPMIQSLSANVRASEWMRSNAQFILPGSMFSGYPHSFPDTLDFGVLYDQLGPIIPASQHFDKQFWRANIDPSERYVLTTKGSTMYRLRAGDTGYSNLVIAGDWTFTGLNYGCVEAAVMSGMEACRAICGSPKIIFGENYPLP